MGRGQEITTQGKCAEIRYHKIYSSEFRTRKEINSVSFLLFTSLNSELAPNTVEDFKNLRFNPFNSDNSLCVSDSSEPANDCKRMRTLGGKAHVYANVPL